MFFLALLLSRSTLAQWRRVGSPSFNKMSHTTQPSACKQASQILGGAEGESRLRFCWRNWRYSAVMVAWRLVNEVGEDISMLVQYQALVKQQPGSRDGGC